MENGELKVENFWNGEFLAWRIENDFLMKKIQKSEQEKKHSDE